MRKLRLQLQTKIALLIIVVILISIANAAFLIVRWRMANIKEDVEGNIMNIAGIVANTPVVKTNLGKYEGQVPIQSYVEDIMKATNYMDIIVVADMKGIRFGHPVSGRVGEAFVGGDEKRVIQKGESYISEAEGTLGHEIRAFVPVYNQNREQVGFVMVGEFIENVEKVKKNTLDIVMFSSLISILLGIIGAFVLSNRIKSTMLGYEPEQITQLYIEKTELLEAMQEGIIAVDKNCSITLINKAAIKILKLGDKDSIAQEIIGSDINDIFPGCRLSEIVKTGEEDRFREQIINDTIVVINRIPIKEREDIVGAIATFNDKTEVTRLVEEVTGVRQIVEALRANNHEFSNKLHLLLGYIQLNRLEDAKRFIVNETEKHQHILSFIMNNILDSTVAALLLGKISRAKELGIAMEINEKSNLYERSGRITGVALVTVIGNLLENAMEALSTNYNPDKRVCVTVKEDDNEIYIKVEDNGPGIDEKTMPLIFNPGYSTKKGNRGRGLVLLKDTVDSLQGFIKVHSKLDEGTAFTIVIPKNA